MKGPAAGAAAVLLVLLLVAPPASALPIVESVVFQWGLDINGHQACVRLQVGFSGVTLLDVAPCLG